MIVILEYDVLRGIHLQIHNYILELPYKKWAGLLKVSCTSINQFNNHNMKSNPVTNYLKECFDALHQVTWPTKNQAIRYTVITLAFCAVFGAIIALLDYAFHTIYSFLILS